MCVCIVCVCVCVCLFVQTSVTEAQFVMFLGPKSSVEEATELFHDLDGEESGYLDVPALVQVIPI